MATSTERSRRLRRHRNDDHSLCDPARCADATGVASGVASVAIDAGITLGARGRQLWAELTTPMPSPAARVLIEEACRIVDRLDRLDACLAGGAWLTGFSNDAGDEITVVVDKALAEARQQALALKAIVAELRQSSAAPATAEEGSVLDQLAARRKARLANAAGQ